MLIPSWFTRALAVTAFLVMVFSAPYLHGRHQANEDRLADSISKAKGFPTKEDVEGMIRVFIKESLQVQPRINQQKGPNKGKN